MVGQRRPGGIGLLHIGLRVAGDYAFESRS